MGTQEARVAWIEGSRPPLLLVPAAAPVRVAPSASPPVEERERRAHANHEDEPQRDDRQLGGAPHHMPEARLDEVAAEPEVHDEGTEDQGMCAPAEALREPSRSQSHHPGSIGLIALWAESGRRHMIDPGAFAALTLPELEEAAGELHRRIGVSLRHAGEPRADAPDDEGRSPRRRVAEHVAMLEAAAATLASVASGDAPPGGRYDRHPATVLAVMYATPTIPALLARLEQDRRLLVSLGRGLETRLDEPRATAWGETPLRTLFIDTLIVEAARCAQSVELHVAALDEATTQAEV